jgi:hypothetical protein
LLGALMRLLLAPESLLFLMRLTILLMATIRQ